MNTIRPRPYPQKGNGSYNAAGEGADKDGRNPQGQERRQNQDPREQKTVASGRANVMSALQMQPQLPTGYYPQSQMLQGGMTGRQISPISYQQINPQQYQTIQQNPQPINQVSNASASPFPAQVRSNKVNIAQILKDFRGTMKAIATPAEIEEQVNKYLEIVEQQVKNQNPQVNLIQSNLKIAGSMLDKYISETLKKDSKVVQNWLDALFLQRINYSYNEEEVNPTFSVQFSCNKNEENAQNSDENVNSEKEENVVQTERQEVKDVPVQNINERQENGQIEILPENFDDEFEVAQKQISKKPNITIIPQDTRLRSLFVEAKKQAFSNNPQKAMAIFKEAFTRAGELKDSETQSRICLEIGKIYDDNDFVVQALNSYNKSLQYTTDTNVKSRAHYSMAQIYDDVNQVEPALEHYFTSVSYAGKSDDLIGQSDSLTRIANIFTDKYSEEAFEYYDMAKKLAEQTTDSNMKGYVLSNTADACVQFKKSEKALKYYAEAVKNYEKTNAIEEIAENYKAAAELMIDFNSPNKARTLLKKALVNAVKTKNEDLISEINMLLASVSD